MNIDIMSALEKLCKAENIKEINEVLDYIKIHIF